MQSTDTTRPEVQITAGNLRAQFYIGGAPILRPEITLPYHMNKAVAEGGIDRLDLADILARVMVCEDARESFQDLTGIETVISEA